MNTPSPYYFLLLGLGAWSTFQLLAFDSILDRPRRHLLRMGKDWKKPGDPVPDDYRLEWGLFLVCPYCAGFWIWVVWVIVWWTVPGAVLPAALLIGGRATVVAGHRLLAKEEDR